MFCRHDLRNRKVIAKPTLPGSGTKARKIADGKCVKTIVFTRPIRFAMDEATRLEIELAMFVVKNRLPRVPSATANFRLKKYVIHVRGTRPEASESTENNRQSLMSIVRESGDMEGQIDFRFLDTRDGSARSLGDSAASSSSERRPSASMAPSSTDGCRSVGLGSGSQRSLSSRLSVSFMRPKRA